jgi:nitrogenase molybdenum-iron protein alpha chain
MPFDTFKADFSQKVPPSREAGCRAAGHAFGGSLTSLMDCARGCLMHTFDRDFGQSTNCQMHVASLIAFSVKDSAVIFHGPVGCGSHSHLMDSALKSSGAARGEPRKGARWITTNLSESDVIGGGAEKLREAIIGADRLFAPSSIFVLNTCAPAIIGDDIDEVIRAAQKEVRAAVAPVHCSGFKSKVISTAYDAAYHGILKSFGFGESRPPRAPGAAPVVNLFNAWSMGAADEAEIKRLLGALGIEGRVFVEFRDPHDWADISQGDLNVSFCHVHDLYFLEFLRERLSMPFRTPDIPIGAASTERFVTDIASFFGREREARELLESEREKLDHALAPLLPRLSGKTAALVGGYLRVGATSLLLDDLGLKVVSLTSYNYDACGNRLFAAVAGKLGEVPASVSSQPSELASLLKRLKPDVAVVHGGQGVWAAKSGVPTLPLFAQRFPYFGFQGVWSVARRLSRALANPSFSKNLALRAPLPFRKEWYSRDPFSYVTRAAAPEPPAGESGGKRAQARP